MTYQCIFLQASFASLSRWSLASSCSLFKTAVLVYPVQISGKSLRSSIVWKTPLAGVLREQVLLTHYHSWLIISHAHSGIGLSLTLELAKMHQGTVRVDSAVGEGRYVRAVNRETDVHPSSSTFRVVLPLGNNHLPTESLANDNTTVLGQGVLSEDTVSVVCYWPRCLLALSHCVLLRSTKHRAGAGAILKTAAATAFN